MGELVGGHHALTIQPLALGSHDGCGLAHEGCGPNHKVVMGTQGSGKSHGVWVQEGLI